MRLLVLSTMLAVAAPATGQTATVQSVEPQVASMFDAWMGDNHAPGLVYGIVKDGRLVVVHGLGTQDQDSKRGVTADSRFRIAPIRAAKLLKDAGLMTPRAVALTPGVMAGYDAVRTIWQAGDVLAAQDRLAMNMLMDRTAAGWKADLAGLKGQLGRCRTDAAIEPTTAMAGRFRWTCDNGDLAGSILLAPTPMPTIQELRLTAVPR